MTTTTFTNYTTPVVADWLNDVDAHVYDQKTGAHVSSNISYTPSGTGAVATTVQTKLWESVSVKDFGAVGDGVTDDTAAINAAIAAVYAAGGGVLFFPKGTYLHASTLVLSNFIKYVGEGYSGDAAKTATVLKYTGTGDQLQINNPINTSTGAYITIEDMTLYSTVGGAGKANLADIGSTFLEIQRVTFRGNYFGLILDQSELVNIQSCNFINHTTASMWLVNGAGHTVGASIYYTNRITVQNCQFNESSTCDQVLDDGGTIHTFSNNSFNAGKIQIRSVGARALTIENNEFEGCASHAIQFCNTQSTPGGGGGWSAARGWRVNGNFITGSTAEAAPHNGLIDFQTGCGYVLEMNQNQFLIDTGSPAVPTTDPTTFVNSVSANGNRNEGTLATYYPFNNMGVTYGRGLTLASWTPMITTDGVTPLTNMTVTGSYVLNGSQCTVTIHAVMTGSPSGGAGTWKIPLPFSEWRSQSWIGNALYYDSSTGNAYTGISSLPAGVNYFVPVQANGTATFLVNSNTVPFAWAVGDTLDATITYSAQL